MIRFDSFWLSFNWISILSLDFIFERVAFSSLFVGILSRPTFYLSTFFVVFSKHNEFDDSMSKLVFVIFFCSSLLGQIKIFGTQRFQYTYTKKYVMLRWVVVRLWLCIVFESPYNFILILLLCKTTGKLKKIKSNVENVYTLMWKQR